VLGRPIKVILYDDEGSDEEAVAVVKKLIDRDQVIGVLGEVASKNSLAGGSICEHEHVPMISPSKHQPRRDTRQALRFPRLLHGRFSGCGRRQVRHTEAMETSRRFHLRGSGLQQEAFAVFYGGLFQIRADRGGREVRDLLMRITRRSSREFNRPIPTPCICPGYYNNICLILKQARQSRIERPVFRRRWLG